ncbi:hypothetical protein G3I38_05250 [Streptomyces sp. SID7958]|uniref:Uncharacterized protein n=1 Tax=Streptomyces sp. SID7958 TaxID=2706093 RepID=A0A6G3TXG1_9ACTN|nr:MULTISPECIES: hypothetical protein [unclassified Streptomyces]NEC78667.1 hypothetical protein [Streptomyces sp. SID7958]
MATPRQIISSRKRRSRSGSKAHTAVAANTDNGTSPVNTATAGASCTATALRRLTDDAAPAPTPVRKTAGPRSRVRDDCFFVLRG